MKPPFRLHLTTCQWIKLRDHLFPGDGDEHGAVILAGIATTGRGSRLLARELVLARDGIDYVPGDRGHRMLTAEFIHDQIDRAEAEGLAYVAIHCHGGTTAVALSPTDLTSHERGYPALLDILDGAPVAGAVFATSAAAGDIWLPGRSRHPLDQVIVNGTTRIALTPRTDQTEKPSADAIYGRQALLFGAVGQRILQDLTVVVVGCGGIGSIVVELLARLGVGHLILVDDDIVEITNVPRIFGSTRRDALDCLTRPSRPDWVQRIGRRLATKKVMVAKRVALQANPACRVQTIVGNVADDAVAHRLTDADFVFLAADTFRARLVVNAIAFQYRIPSVQLGAKVTVKEMTGEILDVYSVVRPFGPDTGCLWCNGLIPPARLADEGLTVAQRKAQRYVEDDEVVVPSVATLNSVAASHGVNEFMFNMTGLPRDHDGGRYVEFRPIEGSVEYTAPRRDPNCPECGGTRRSRVARGDANPLPTRRR